MLRLRSLLALSLALFALPACAATLNVGAGQTYSKIQDAITAAGNGDTVLVFPGTYFENINFRGNAATDSNSNAHTQTLTLIIQ